MRNFRAAAALLTLCLAASACGGDGGFGGGELSGQSLEVAVVWSGDEQASFEAVLQAFEDETGATVDVTSTGDDIATVLGTRLEGGDPPDLAVLPQPGLLRDLAAQGSLVDIEEAAGHSVDNNYARVWRELGSVDDTLYGVWFKAANKSTVWYNTQVFSDAGVGPAENWDAMIANAETISDSGVTPFSIGGADGWTLTDWFENVYVRTAGPDMYDQLANHEIPWTHDSVKAALQTLAEVFGRPELIAGGTSGALQTAFVGSVTRVFEDPPQAAMVYEGDFVAGEIRANTNAVVGEDADFFPFPSIDGSGPAVIGGGDVAVLLNDTEAGRELMSFLATAEAAEIWAERGGFTSPNQQVDLDAYPDETSRGIAEALTEAEVFRFDLSDLQPSAFGSTPGQGLFKQFQDFLADPSNIDGITSDMEAAAAAAYGN
ncbi:MAG: extracellular solute-binding protein [Actinomycetota bacterium]